MKLKTNKILDYLGLVPKCIEKVMYIDAGNGKRESVGRDNIQVWCSDVTYKNTSECTSYMEITFKRSADLRVMYRRYITIIDTTGAIGESLNALFSVFAS